MAVEAVSEAWLESTNQRQFAHLEDLL